MSDEEVRIIVQSFHGMTAARDKALFLLGLKSGFRISERLSLRVGDVWQAGRIVDRVTVARRHMKQQTEGRTVVLHPEAKAALAAWLSTWQGAGDIPAEAYLFRSRQGENRAISRVQAWRILQSLYASNGLTGRLGTHSMRKTFAKKISTVLERDFVKTQRALGHRNVNSTVHSLSFREEEIDAAILAC